MKTKTSRTPKPTEPQTLPTNFNRPWHPTSMVSGNLILNWHGHEIARVCSNKMTEQESKDTRELIVTAVNVYEAAMKVVHLAALMKHTCAKREGGQTVTVHACLRCLAEVAQAREEAR